MRVLPLAVGSDFYLHDYLTQRTPKGRDENGHLSGGRVVVVEQGRGGSGAGVRSLWENLGEDAG